MVTWAVKEGAGDVKEGFKDSSTLGQEWLILTRQNKSGAGMGCVDAAGDAGGELLIELSMS